jgi:hypothetical protein
MDAETTKENKMIEWTDREALSLEEIYQLNIPIGGIGWIIMSILADRHTCRAAKLARRIALDVAHLWVPPDIVARYLTTGDELLARDAYRAADQDASVAAWVARDAIRAAKDARALTWAARDAVRVTQAVCPTTAYTTNEEWTADRGEAAWKKYIEWAIEVAC